jgi:hypothetical protein
VGGVGGVGVWGVVVWGHSLRSTFHRLHLLRLWTPTILLKNNCLTVNCFLLVRLLSDNVLELILLSFPAVGVKGGTGGAKQDL